MQDCFGHFMEFSTECKLDQTKSSSWFYLSRGRWLIEINSWPTMDSSKKLLGQSAQYRWCCQYVYHDLSLSESGYEEALPLSLPLFTQKETTGWYHCSVWHLRIGGSQMVYTVPIICIDSNIISILFYLTMVLCLSSYIPLEACYNLGHWRYNLDYSITNPHQNKHE